MPGVCGRRLRRLGTPANVPRVRGGRLLRLVTAPTRDGTLRGGRASGDALDRARRVLALVLHRRTARVKGETPTVYVHSYCAISLTLPICRRYMSGGGGAKCLTASSGALPPQPLSSP